VTAMRAWSFVLFLLLVGGCCAAATALLSTTDGQLFCAVSADGGAAVTVGVIDAVASALAPPASPVVVLATGALASTVQNDCALAAKATGLTAGIPVSPPAAPAPNVAIVPIASPARLSTAPLT